MGRKRDGGTQLLKFGQLALISANFVSPETGKRNRNMSRAGQAGTADVVGMPNSLTDRLSDCLTEGRTDRLTEAQAGLHAGHFQVLCTLKALLLLLLLPGRFNKVSAAQTLIPFIKKLFICQFLPFSRHYAVMLPIVVHIAKFHSASRSNSSSRSIYRFQ